MVYKFCKARSARRVFAIRGQGGEGVPYIKRPTKNNREQAQLFTLGVDTGKAILLDRLKVELVDDDGNDLDSVPGYCHFPKERDRGYTQEYFKGLTAEHRIMTYKKGRAIFEWRIKDSAHKRNEALDCRNYATAALEISKHDDLQISLDDRDRTWLRWLNEKGSAKGVKIRAVIVQKNWNGTGRDRKLNCGTFELDSIDFSSPPGKVNIKATSIFSATERTSLNRGCHSRPFPA